VSPIRHLVAGGLNRLSKVAAEVECEERCLRRTRGQLPHCLHSRFERYHLLMMFHWSLDITCTLISATLIVIALSLDRRRRMHRRARIRKRLFLETKLGPNPIPITSLLPPPRRARAPQHHAVPLTSDMQCQCLRCHCCCAALSLWSSFIQNLR